MRLRYGLLILLLPALVGCSADRRTAADWKGATIVIGIDGLRWDDPQKFGLSAIQEIGDAGVRAGALIPVFPTKTFPNFYALATGLYPNHSGILENTMYDPVLDAGFRMGDTAAVRDPKWWGGEPIWVSAEKQDVRAAVFFWPGSEAPIEGVRPTHWREYDGSVEGADRIDQLLRWLDEPPPDRPGLLMVYFSEVDDAGHRFGPEAPETAAAARDVDRLVGTLVSELKRRDLFAKVNLVVVSDHGMAARSSDRIIFLDDFVNPESAGILTLGQYVTLWPQPEAIDSVYLALAGAHPALKVYKREDLPPRYHLAGHRRTPPIVAVPATGWTVSTHAWVDRHPRGLSGGAHGYDNASDEMHAVFAAEGPAFRSNVRIDSLRAVDVYQLVAHALRIDPAENDGDPSLVPRLMTRK